MGFWQEWAEKVPLNGIAPLVALGLLLLAAGLLPREERRRVRRPFLLLVISILAELLSFPSIFDGNVRDFFDSLSLLLLLWSIGESAFLLVARLVVRVIYPSAPRIFLDIMLVVVYAAMLLVMLRDAGAQLSSLVTGSALVTGIIGLSLKDTFGNIFAGLAIQAQRPFEVGDWIQFDDRTDHIGKVLEINWRATKVITLDVVEVIVPNAKLADYPIRNFTKPERWSRRSLYIVCPYSAAPGTVHRIILDALRESWGVNPTPTPSVVTNAFLDRGIEYWIRFFTAEFDSRDKVDGGARDRIWYALHRHGIHVPPVIAEVDTREVTPERKAIEALDNVRRRKRDLRRVDIFQVLPEESMDRLALLANTRHYLEGEAIIREGDEGDELYIVRTGEVIVWTGTGGNSVEIARLGPGRFFGEMALLTGARRKATIRAGKDCELLVVGKEALGGVLAEHPELAERICETLTTRDSQLTQRRAESAREAALVGDDGPSLLARIKDFLGV